MSDLTVNFDLDSVSDGSFGVIPAGTLRAVVTDVETTADYEGSGQTLRIKLSFLDGELQNRRTVAFCDIESATDWKQSQGRRMVKQLVVAQGLEGMRNYAQLISDTPVGVKIRHYNAKAGDVKDSVSGFEAAVAPAAASSDGGLDASPF